MQGVVTGGLVDLEQRIERVCYGYLNVVECVFDNFRNVGEANFFGNEALDGNFVCSVVDSSAVGFLFECLVCKF